MIFKSHIELKKGRLDIAPLVDIVFLLLIFFMLTSNFMTRQGITVNLPKASSGGVLPGDSLVIFVSSSGTVSISGKEISPENLDREISAAAREKKSILIKSDKQASLGVVIDVWDMCRDEGISNINIATIPRR